jgi:hypothetical protein
MCSLVVAGNAISTQQADAQRQSAYLLSVALRLGIKELAHVLPLRSAKICKAAKESNIAQCLPASLLPPISDPLIDEETKSFAGLGVFTCSTSRESEILN